MTEVAEFSISVRTKQQRAEVLTASFSFSETADDEFLLWGVT